jgi:DNA-binding NtrC family response regulator
MSDAFLARKRILLVDDEPALLGALGGVLRRRRRDWNVDFGVGGRAALEHLGRVAYDVVVTDLRMPDVGGVEVLRAAGRLQPRAARIVFSGEIDLSEALTAVLNAHRFVSKPCPASELEAVIEECLADGRQSGPRPWAGAQATPEVAAGPRTGQTFARVTARARTAAEVAQLVQQDAALSAKVLHVANSGFCGRPRPITSLAVAVQELGLAVLRDLSALEDQLDHAVAPEPEQQAAQHPSLG